MIAPLPMASGGLAALPGPRAARLRRVASFGLLWRPLCGLRLCDLSRKAARRKCPAQACRQAFAPFSLGGIRAVRFQGLHQANALRSQTDDVAKAALTSVRLRKWSYCPVASAVG